MAVRSASFWRRNQLQRLQHNPDRQTTRMSRTGLSTTSVLKIVLNCIALLLCNYYSIPTVSAAAGATEPLEHCFRQSHMGTVGTCLGQRALSYLQNFEDSANVTLFDGSLKIIREDNNINLGTQSRSIVNFLDLNPSDFTGIFDGVSNMMQSRSMKWELDQLYPGLQMRVGPYHGMNSVLEFVLDPDQDVDGARKAFYSNESPSVGRAITKSFLLPFLLGFKFNLSLVLPILIGLLIIVGKKIVFISKLVLLLSGVFGWGVPFASHGLGYGQNHQYGHKPLFQDGFYRKEFSNNNNDRDGGRATYNIEVTERPYDFDRFYDYEKKQNRFDLFSTYEDEFKPRNEDRPIETNFQTSKTSASKRQFGWRTAS